MPAKPPKKRVPAPGRTILLRLRRRVETLNRKGIFDSKQIRRIITRQEAEFWLKRAKRWARGTWKKGGSAQFRAQLERMLNKAATLVERIEKSKTSVKRRKLIKELSLVRFPPAEIMERLPIEHRMRVLGVLAFVATSLEERALNKRLPESERVAAIRALAEISGNDMEYLVGIMKRDLTNAAIKNEISRMFAKYPTNKNITILRRMFLSGTNPDLLVLGIRTLANMGNPAALETLTKMIERRPPRADRKLPGPKVRESLYRGFVEVLKEEHWGEKLRDLLGGMQQSILTQMELTGGFHMRAYVFYTGLAARSITQWVEKFSKKISVPESLYRKLLRDLEEKRKEMVIMKRSSRIETDYAIAHIDRAIKAVRKAYLG